VSTRTYRISRILVAALLIWSAAICAAAQSKAKKKKSAPKPATVEAAPQSKAPAPSVAPPPAKQNSRTPADGSVQNEPATKPVAIDDRQASQASAAAAKPASEAATARFSYEFTQPNFLISRLFIEHDENGRGEITFERKDSEPICDPLNLSPATVARLKSLWSALHFLDTQQSYQSEKQYPHLGTNRLHMKEGTRDRVAEFNWTGDKDAFALVTEYKRIANQAVFIFDITLARENQPLEAPKIMDQIDDYLRRNEVADPQQLLPLMRELTTDERLPLIARNHAARLLKRMEK
jgi:hypothetical protein